MTKSGNILPFLAVAAVTAFCVQIFSANQADVDLWGNVFFVQAPAWAEGFHRINTFSFTEPGHGWINHEWLAQYSFHSVHRLFGNAGLIGLKVVIGLLIIGLMNAAIRKECRSGVVRFLWLMLVISVMGFGFNTRPHLFTFLMVAVFLTLLGRPKFSSWLVLWIPLLGLIWVNLHGAFFIGLIILGIFLVGRGVPPSRLSEVRNLAVLAGALALFIGVTFVNPYGVALWKFVAGSAATVRPYLTEWAPFDWRVDFAEHADFVVLSVIVFGGLVFTRIRRDPAGMALLVISFLAALMMRRNIPLFALVAGFVAVRHVDSVVGERLSRLATRVPARVLVVLAALFILLSVFYTVTFNKTNPLQIEVARDRVPVELVVFLETNQIQGNALIFFDWAEYGIRHLYPNCRVFLDGRFTDAYDIATVNDYFNFLYAGKGWETALQRYPTDIVLIHRQLPVYAAMTALPGWQLVAETDLAGLFLKTDVHARTVAQIRTRELRLKAIPGPVYFP